MPKIKQLKPDTRVGVVYSHLRSRAFEKGPGAKLPTTRELCEEFGLGRITLDMALDKLEADNIIFRKQGSGIFVSPNLHQKQIRIYFNSGLIARAGLSPFWGMLSGLVMSEVQRRSAADRNAYHFELLPASVFHDPDETDERMRLYEEGLIHGMISIGMGAHPQPRPIDAAVPLVTYADAGHWSVGTPFVDQVRAGIGALKEIGCSRIAVWDIVWDDEPEYRDGKLLLPILQPLFDGSGLALNPEMIIQPRRFVRQCPGSPRLIHQEQGYLMAMNAFKQQGPRPDGVFIADDMLAHGVLTAFDEFGIKPGTDAHVASMSNTGSPILFGYEDHLTLVESDPAMLVTALFDLLEVLMAGGTPSQEMLTVSPSLIKPGTRMRRAEMKAWGGL